ncbi:GNAT family N-acetyltransferase [Candidatus Woesearchaeota archaeon]|nr:GNAT family N-acetyltransferase [Candidatus Woesearchaeota archaeon]
MIRKATKKDIKAIASIEANSGYLFRDRIDLNSEISKINKNFEKGCDYFVCCSEENPIAYLAVFTKKKILKIDYLSVLKEYHGKGIGTLFLQYVEDYAKKHNFTKIFLEVNNRNYPAISLYNNFGYYVTKVKVRTNYRKKIIKLFMEKNLNV